MRNFQRVTGQTAEEASHFVAAFDDMGISADTASTAMFKLSKNISGGGTALTDLGIGIAHAADGTVDLQGTFLNIADAVSKTSDPTERAAIAFGAFGKQGAALLPILEKGRAGIQKLFAGADLNFSQAQLDSAEDYRLAMDHLGDSVGKVENRLGATLVPTLAKTADGTARLVDGTLNAIDHNSVLKDGVTVLGNTFLNVAAGPLNAAIGGLGFLSKNSDDSKVSMDQAAEASAFLGTSMESLAGKTADQVAALVQEKQALDDVYAATLAQFDANFAYQDSLNATEDAAALVVEKQNALNEVLKTHTADSTEAKTASEELSRALLAQQEQALQSATAAGRVAEETAKMGGAQDATIPKIDAQIAELERQKTQVDARNIPAIQGMIDQLNKIKSEYPTSVSVKDNASPTIAGIQARLDRLRQSGNLTIGPGPGGLNWLGKGRERALGGPVWGGDWLVAEGTSRAEMLHLNPGSSGWVTNAAETRQMVSSDNRQVSVVVNEVANDPQATAFAVATALGERSQR